MQSWLTVVRTGPGEYDLAAPKHAFGALNTFAKLNVAHHKARAGSSKEGPAIGCIVVHQLAVVQQSPAVPLQDHHSIQFNLMNHSIQSLNLISSISQSTFCTVCLHLQDHHSVSGPTICTTVFAYA